MATENALESLSYSASADLSALQYTFVKQSTGAKQIAAVAAATDVPCGVLQNKPTSGQAATVGFKGVSKVKAGGTIAVGDLVGTTSAGLATTLTPGTDTTKYVCGRAESAGISGDIISVNLLAVPHRAA